jgi:hypothetical protein
VRELRIALTPEVEHACAVAGISHHRDYESALRFLGSELADAWEAAHGIYEGDVMAFPAWETRCRVEGCDNRIIGGDPKPVCQTHWGAK